MLDRMHYQLELSGETATLYVARTLRLHVVTSLSELFRSLPAHVRTLRLDLRALGAMTAETTGAIRLLFRNWRDSRHGEYRLSTSYLVATFSEVRTPAFFTQPAHTRQGAVT